MTTISGDTENGFGKMRWENGHEYEGQWKGGKKHGRGVFTWAGNRYEGSFADDKRIAKMASDEGGGVREPEVGDAVECIAFNNIVRNWKTGVVTDKRITQGAQTSQGEGEVCLKGLCNVLTCFMFKSSCCPDVYVYSIKYGDGRVETGVPAERVRKTYLDAQQPLAATQVELAITQQP
jgi:hypothetical protein